MRSTTVVSLLAAVALIGSTAFADSRVKGAELLDAEGATMESVMSKIIGLPFDQAEIDLFLANIDGLEKWAKANKAEWDSVQTSEDMLAAIKGLGVWSTLSIKSSEFIALVLKLSTAQQIASGQLSAADLEQQKAFFEGMMKNMSEEEKAQIQPQLEIMDAMIAALKNYPADALKAYEANKEKIDAAMERFQKMTEEGEGEGDGN